MNIRLKTKLIVRRGPDFLVGKILYSHEYRWSDSPWAAWGTRRREAAEFVARQTGGDLWLFNPINGALREARFYEADADARGNCTSKSAAGPETAGASSAG